MNIVRVLVVDDHKIVREGIVAMLKTQDDMDVVGEAENGDEAVKKVERLKPNVVLMDISMPGLNGIRATQAIKRDFPEINVVMLTMLDQEGYIYEAIKAGATGYLLKNTSVEDLVGTIRRVNEGHASLYPEAQKQLLKEYVTMLKKNSETYGLSKRELEILQKLANGMTNKEIAEELFISTQTVKTHIAHIFNKLGVKDRTEAVANALRRGLVT